MSSFFGSIPSAILFFMAIFLYAKRCNWRKLKETKSNFIKFITAILLAVLLKKIFVILHSGDISRNFTDTLEVIFAVLVAVIWIIEYKRNKT